MSRSLGISATAALLAFAGTASADAPAPAAAPAAHVKVAIVPGVAVNMEPARVDALAGDMAAALSSELLVDAVGGLEVRRALPAEGVPPDCVTTPACVADVAARTGAQQLLFVVMVDSGAGGSIQIDSTWVEPATNKSAARPAVDIATISEARSRFTAVAHGLLPDAATRPKVKATQNIHVDSAGGVPRHFTTPALITAGVAIVGLGVGVGFGLAARSKYNTCDDMAATCTSDQKDSIRTVSHVADAGWILAIGGAIASTVFYARSGEEPHFIIAPMSDGAAVSAFGTF
jgi:hypothetical protein